MKLLPAYLKRGGLEEKVFLGAVAKVTLEESFAYLKERLDPEEETFEAAAKFLQMTGGPGELVQDFFALLARGSEFRDGLTMCVFMVSQVLSEVQQKTQRMGQTQG